MVNWSFGPALLVSSLLLGGLAGCSQSLDPCPPGSIRSDSSNKCLIRGPSGVGDGGIDAHVPGGDGDGDVVGGDGDKHGGDGDKHGDGDAPPHGDGDAATGDGDAPPGGDGDKPPHDGGPDADAGDGGHDAGDSGPGPHDGGPDASDSGPPDTCEADGVTAWSAFHTEAGLVAKIGTCSASDPSCQSDKCALGDCLRKAASVNGCSTCVDAEVLCVAMNCQAVCSGSNTDSHCRACACANGCVKQFDTCSGAVGSIYDQVCGDCDGNDCGNMSVMPPELIMVVVDQILFAPTMVTP